MTVRRPGLLLPAFLSALLFILGPSQAQSVGAKNMLKLSRSYAEQNDWDKAREYAEKALAEEPGYLDALYMRAFAYREMEKYDKAEADFKEVIRRDPKYLPTYGALAEVYLRQKDYEKADELFGDLSKAPGGAKWASYQRGVVAYLQGNLDTAERHWKDVLMEDTNFAPALHNLGALYLAKGENPRALLNFREALDKKSDKAMYRFHVAWALERTGQIEAAQRMLKTVMDENADDQQFWLLARGLDRLTRGQADTAVKVLETVSEQHPDNLDVWVLLGRAHLKLNQPDKAREALEKAKELDSTFQEVKELLGRLPKESEVEEVPEPSPEESEKSEDVSPGNSL